MNKGLLYTILGIAGLVLGYFLFFKKKDVKQGRLVNRQGDLGRLELKVALGLARQLPDGRIVYRVPQGARSQRGY